MKVDRKRAKAALAAAGNALTASVGESARLRERIEKLEACVKAGEALIDSIYEIVGCNLQEIRREKAAYLAARAALGEVEREG